MKKRAPLTGYCLHCGKESEQPFCNRQCYLDYVRSGNYNEKEYEKKRRDSLSDSIVKKNIYIASKGSIKYSDMTPEMIVTKRESILAHRQRKEEIKVEREANTPAPKEIIRVCIIYGNVFDVKGKSLVCGDECRKADGRRKYYVDRDVILKKMRDEYEPKPKTEQTCKQCGTVFMGHNEEVNCSDVCRRKEKQQRKAKRRAAKAGVYYEPVNPIKVFERDGWRCQICKKKLNLKHRGTMCDDAPELDHIIPWAQGGEHSYRNTQCACRKCNEEKGSAERGQLRMFG
jgi:5-methylcytosine-specific restriction endonuclease McrA